MNTLYILIETYTNGYRVEVLDIISLISVLCGILVIISKNPIVSVLFLIGLFLSISCYLIILGLNFIGLSYLLVYVGAVSILFLFILMLINVRICELTTDNSNSIPLAIMIGIFFFVTLYKLLPTNLSSIFNIYSDSNVGSVNNMSNSTHYTPMSSKDLSVLASNNDISFVSSHI